MTFFNIFVKSVLLAYDKKKIELSLYKTHKND